MVEKLAAFVEPARLRLGANGFRNNKIRLNYLRLDIKREKDEAMTS